MHIGRPVLFKIIILVVEIAESRDIVGKCIHPDVHDMVFIKVNRDSPFKAGSGDTEILQARLDEIVDHLVDAGSRLQERARFQQVLHRLCILGETEEIGFLFRIVHFTPAVGALSVHQLALCPEALTGCAVHTFVGTLVDIPVVIHFTENPLDRLDMVIIGCADKAVVGNIHQLPQIQDALRPGDDIVHKLLRRHTGCLRFLFNFLAVLVRPGKEHDVITAQALITSNHVRCHRAVGMADVQLVRGVIDRGGDVKCFLFHVWLLLHNINDYSRCPLRNRWISWDSTLHRELSHPRC